MPCRKIVKENELWVCYLVAETSTGKAFDIEVRGVPLEDVLPMLESIVIH